ncbi:hypothetical protein DFH06DRAFT_1130970 [Mycena polygramma]|nr:hypothetical protein DFH06DRAFT_1130970 [Mycena polygramma]
MLNKNTNVRAELRWPVAGRERRRDTEEVGGQATLSLGSKQTKTAWEELPEIRTWSCRTSREIQSLRPLTLYCGAQCQKMDWPRHKQRCGMYGETAQTILATEIDEMAAGSPVILPMQAVEALFTEWVWKYRALVCFSLLRAQGYWDRPPSEHPIYDIPQVLYVKMSAAPGISSKTKGRAAFRIVSAELLPFSELRIAAATPGHPMCNQRMQYIVEDFDSQLADRAFAGTALRPYYSLSMVVHRLDFHNGFSAMAFHKHWYLERDTRADLTQQWRPPADDWLDFLKATVAAGEGWDRDDIDFNGDLAKYF